jgi:hypothetical protein
MDFGADKWSELSKAERIERCRMAAREAESFAKSAGPESRPLYYKLVARWHILADEIESHQP